MTETQQGNAKLERIRKILHLAESEAKLGHHDAAENLRQRAYGLMTEYGVDEAMLAASEKRQEKPVQRCIMAPDPYGRDKQYLLGMIARPLGCKTVRITGTRERHSIVVGFESDVERVEILFTSLLVQAFGELGKIASQDVFAFHSFLTSAERGRARTSFNKSWLMGFAATVRDRLAEANRRARQEYEAKHSTSTELVLATRESQVEAAYTDFFPKLNKPAQRRISSVDGYFAGERAGQRANIGTTQVGGQRRTLAQ